MILSGIIALVIPLFFIGIIITSQLTGSLLKIFSEEGIINAKNMATIISITIEREMDYISAVAVDNTLSDLMAQKKYSAAMEHLKTNYKRIKADSLGFLLIDTAGYVRADISNDSLHLDISDRSYFLQAKAGSAGIEGPFTARQNNKRMLMAISHPIYKEKKLVGVLVIALDMKYLIAMTSSIRSGKTGYIYITNNKGVAIIHPQKEILFKDDVYLEKGLQSLIEKLKNNVTG
jgi:methyl-accepting chemotaxis protein